MPIPIRIRFG